MSNASDEAVLEAANEFLNSTVAASQGRALGASDWWSTTNAMTMCAVLLVFSLIVLGLSTYLLKSGMGGTSVLRIFGTILVITMTTFLVVAGYDDQQIAAPLGLLGTVVGYLLGRESRQSEDAPSGGRRRDDP